MAENNSKKKNKGSVFREYAEAIIVAVGVALILRAFVVEAFKIPSPSMVPTLRIGDHIFVNKFVYGFRIPFTKKKFFQWRQPKRGEVIVFIFPEDPSKDYIKRVIGIPGDKIQIRSDDIFINGEKVPREISMDSVVLKSIEGWSQYVLYDETLGGNHFQVLYRPNFHHLDDWPVEGQLTVPENSLFVMGDNRDNSSDSRLWRTTNFVPISYVKGKAMVIWLSIDSDHRWSPINLPSLRWSRFGKLIH